MPLCGSGLFSNRSVHLFFCALAVSARLIISVILFTISLTGIFLFLFNSVKPTLCFLKPLKNPFAALSATIVATAFILSVATVIRAVVSITAAIIIISMLSASLIAALVITAVSSALVVSLFP